MERYQTKVEDDTLYVEDDDGWLEIGEFEDIYELVGGREYTIEYDDDATKVSWLQTDDDNTITFDVRETLEDMSYQQDMVQNLRNCGMERDDEGHPQRTILFTDLMTQIWDSKGNLHEEQ